MKLPSAITRNQDIIIASLISIPLIALITWALPPYVQNLEYDQLKRRIIGGDSYLKDAVVLDRNSISVSKSGGTIDGDLHLRIPRDKARQILTHAPILSDCSLHREKCPDKAWRSYADYTAAYGKLYVATNYQGKQEVRNNDPALSSLVGRKDLENISCTTYHVRLNTAYGICVDPNSGDLWYHYYRNWQPYP